MKGGWFPADFGVMGQEEYRVSMGAGRRGTAVFAEGNSAEESQTQGAEQAAEQLKAGHVTVRLKHRQKSAAIQKALHCIQNATGQ